MVQASYAVYSKYFLCWFSTWAECLEVATWDQCAVSLLVSSVVHCSGGLCCQILSQCQAVCRGRATHWQVSGLTLLPFFQGASSNCLAAVRCSSSLLSTAAPMLARQLRILLLVSSPITWTCVHPISWVEMLGLSSQVSISLMWKAMSMASQGHREYLSALILVLFLLDYHLYRFCFYTFCLNVNTNTIYNLTFI